MSSHSPTVLIMAGGTGGHIFPALAIAEQLRLLGVRVEWLGSRHGMENELIGKSDIPLHVIAASGLRGKGLVGMLRAPFMITAALLQALRVMRQVRPGCVLGMGGFVTGPGGIAARLSRIRLLIHEQNAVAGVTNRILARFAWRVMEAFPGTFRAAENVMHTGNPVRQGIAVSSGAGRVVRAEGPLRLLVLGGSQGAASINELIPRILNQWPGENRPEVVHQTGKRNLQQALDAYRALQLDPDKDCEVTGFIDDMAARYRWADIVLARSGASTVFELAAAGLPSILVPYPWHRDQQQVFNARWLADAGAAVLIEQGRLTADALLEVLRRLSADRGRLQSMAMAAGSRAILDADHRIARTCMEAINV